MPPPPSGGACKQVVDDFSSPTRLAVAMFVFGAGDFEDWDIFVQQLHRKWQVDEMVRLQNRRRLHRGLIVDQDATARQKLQLALLQFGCHATTRKHVDQAIEEIFREEFTFAVIDCGCDNEGLELLDIVHHTTSACTILCGTIDQVEFASATVALHCNMVVTKPYDPTSVARFIAKAVA